MSLFKSTTSLAPTLSVTAVTSTTTSSTVEANTSGVKKSVGGFFSKIITVIEEKIRNAKNSITGTMTPEFKRVKSDGTMGEPIKFRGDKLSTTITTTSTTATIYGIDKDATEKRMREIKNASLNRCIECTSTEDLETALEEIEARLNPVQDENMKKIDSLSDQELERVLQSHDLLPVDTDVKTYIK